MEPMHREAMGIVVAKVRISSADRFRARELELIVDPGSTLTWVAAEVLEGLGHQPVGKQRFRTVDGSTVERPVGDAPVECEGQRGFVGVVFAGPGDASVLGVTALERLGLEVNPSTGTLRKIDAYLALAT